MHGRRGKTNEWRGTKGCCLIQLGNVFTLALQNIFIYRLLFTASQGKEHFSYSQGVMIPPALFLSFIPFIF